MNLPFVGDGGWRANVLLSAATSSQHFGGCLPPTSAVGSMPLSLKLCCCFTASSRPDCVGDPVMACSDCTNSAIEVQPYIANRSGNVPLLSCLYHWLNSATSGITLASSPWYAAKFCGMSTPSLDNRPNVCCCGTRGSYAGAAVQICGFQCCCAAACATRMIVP